MLSEAAGGFGLPPWEFVQRGHDRPRDSAGNSASEKALLPVVFQDLIAGGRNLLAVFLQAGQNREIALIHYLAAETLDITPAGLLLVGSAATGRLLLGDGTGGNRYRQQDKCQEEFLHRIPSFRQQMGSTPNSAWDKAEPDCWEDQVSQATAAGAPEATIIAAKFAIGSIRSPQAIRKISITRRYFKAYFPIRYFLNQLLQKIPARR